MEVLVLTSAAECRCALDDVLPEHPALPGLAPRVRDVFRRAPGGAGASGI